MLKIRSILAVTLLVVMSFSAAHAYLPKGVDAHGCSSVEHVHQELKYADLCDAHCSYHTGFSLLEPLYLYEPTVSSTCISTRVELAKTKRLTTIFKPPISL